MEDIAVRRVGGDAWPTGGIDACAHVSTSWRSRAAAGRARARKRAFWLGVRCAAHGPPGLLVPLEPVAAGDAWNEDNIGDEPTHVEVDEKTEQEEKESVIEEEATIAQELPNANRPLWMCKAEEITNEQYASFYKSLCVDNEEPLAVKHFTIAGPLVAHALLFVPRCAPLGREESKHTRGQVKFYRNRVFLSDGSRSLLPEWLHFLRGVIDCDRH